MIINEKKLELKKMDQENLSSELINACYDGNLELVKYVLTSPELKVHSDIHAQNDDAFIWSCSKGHLAIVQYLLISPELKEHADIHAVGDDGLKYACGNGHIDIVKYLLSLPDLKDNTNIFTKENGDGFINACLNKHTEVIKYLIFDHNIEKTIYIDNYLVENKRKDILNMFDKRELESKLQTHLPKSQHILPKIKL